LGIERADGLRFRTELGCLTSFLLDFDLGLHLCLSAVGTETRERWLYLAELILGLLDALDTTLRLTISNCPAFMLVELVACLSFLDLREVREPDLGFFFY
jgi:hypothetical protein